jgi:glycosyltransferase involved in cell wall biosynthesis
MSRRRRIMVVMHYFHEDIVGGAEVQSYLLARELASRGNEVLYLCDRREGKPRETSSEGITIWRRFRSLPLFKVLNLPIFLLALIRFRPDAIYHRYASQYTIFGAIARMFGVRFVWNCCEDKHLERGYFRNELRKHFQTYRGNALKKAMLFADAWLSDMLFSVGARMATAIVAQNSAQQEGIRQRFGRESRIIRSGHPARTMDREGADQMPTILWLATYQQRKRPELFLDAAERCADLPARFVLAGRTANEAFKQYLLDRASQLPNVEPRHVDSYELSWKEFEKAYLYICTSESEGFPNAFIQSWLCGVPVLSVSVDPDGFILKHGLGYVCASVEELADTIRLLVTDRALRDRIGEECRITALRHFDIGRVAASLEEELLGGTSAQHRVTESSRVAEAAE